MMLRAWIALGTSGAASRVYGSAAKASRATNYARDRVLDVISRVLSLCEDDDERVRAAAFEAALRTS